MGVVKMEPLDNCASVILAFLNKALKSKSSVSFNDVIAAKECKKLSVREIGKLLELLRRYGYVRASSRFGCSELLEFSATAVTEKGQQYLSEHKHLLK